MKRYHTSIVSGDLILQDCLSGLLHWSVSCEWWMWLARTVLELFGYWNLSTTAQSLSAYCSRTVQWWNHWEKTAGCKQSRQCADRLKFICFLLMHHSLLNYLFWPTIAKPSPDCSKVENVPHTAWRNARTAQDFQNIVRGLVIGSGDWMSVCICMNAL